LAINNREELLAEVDEKIEKGLELIGSTAIEDKL
jgi:magnesium-transporting ATPase (P-type)